VVKPFSNQGTKAEHGSRRTSYLLQEMLSDHLGFRDVLSGNRFTHKVEQLGRENAWNSWDTWDSMLNPLFPIRTLLHCPKPTTIWDTFGIDFRLGITDPLKPPRLAPSNIV
jgi:hypothetical protein